MSDGAKAVESSGRGYGVERFDAPPMGIETGLTVRRERLLRELAFKAGEAGIALVCAPKGFGKTTLLFQYAATVRSDPERGSVELIDAGRMAKHELRDLLARAGFALSRSSRFDVIVEFYLARGVHDVMTVNEALFAFD